MNELIQKVFEMRKLQKLFYKNHERNTFLAAKAAEYEVDVALEQLGLNVNGPKLKKTQVDTEKKTDPKLF